MMERRLGRPLQRLKVYAIHDVRLCPDRFHGDDLSRSCKTTDTERARPNV